MIYDSLNKKETCLNILIDFSKAFDTVNHDILLRKLNRYGVCGSALSWIRSYLMDREQYVSIGAEVSDSKITNISVPQGSVLGPLLFLIYINDLPNVSRTFSPTMFADDCTLSMIDKNIDAIVSNCNAELARFESWAACNRLSLNSDKTKCLMVSNIHTLNDVGNIYLAGRDLEFVTSSKFLGIFLDSECRFDEHINYICNKVSKSIGILFRIRDFVPCSFLRTLYFSLIHPYFLYCLPIFGATYESHLSRIILLQKRAIRLISNTRYLDNTEPLFKRQEILKFKDLYKHSVACFVYKNQNLLKEFSRTHNYNTRNRDLHLAPYERLRSTRQSVIHNGVKIWDEIPIHIRTCLTIDNFSNRYKTYLLSDYVS